MMNDPASSGRAVLCARAVALSLEDAAIRICDVGSGRPTGRVLPRLLGVKVDWMRRLTTEFYLEHRRCLALVLLLDLGSGELNIELPPQCCQSEGASWRYTELAADPPPPWLVGTFSAAVIAGAWDGAIMVPPIDGMHLIYDPRPGREQLQAYLRVGGRTTSARLEDLVHSTTHAFLCGRAGHWTVMDEEQ